MKINRNNYESFFLSYIENQLQPGEEADLLVFLEHNADLKSELEAFENITIGAVNKPSFKNKDALKKRDYTSTENINAWNFEEKMIAFLEGDLTEIESNEIKTFIGLNPQSKLELNLFRKTFLEPAEIIYPEKNKLKKGGIVLFLQPSLRIAASIAAILTLFFGLSLLLNQKNTPSSIVVERTTETTGQADQEIDDLAKYPAPIIEESRVHKTPNDIETDVENPQSFFVKSLKPIPTRNWDGIILPKNKPLTIDQRDSFKNHDLAEFLSSDNKSGTSFAGRFIRGLTSKIIGQPDLNSISLVELTIDGYNLLADRQVEVDKKLDENGNVVAFNIRGDNLSFFRSFRQSQ